MRLKTFLCTILVLAVCVVAQPDSVNFYFQSGDPNFGYWAFTAGGGTSVTGDVDRVTWDSPNDPNSGYGVLKTTRTGKRKCDGTPAWTLTASLTSLGFPSGQLVDSVNVDYDWSCVQYDTGDSASTVGPCTFWGNYVSAGLAFSGLTSWATRPGTAWTNIQNVFPGRTTDYTLNMAIGASPCTGNSLTAVVTVIVDWVVITVTYHAPPAGTPQSQSVIVLNNRHRRNAQR